MPHVSATDFDGVFPPSVDLTRRSGPHDVVKQYVPKYYDDEMRYEFAKIGA